MAMHHLGGVGGEIQVTNRKWDHMGRWVGKSGDGERRGKSEGIWWIGGEWQVCGIRGKYVA